MATGVSVASVPVWYCYGRNNLLARKPITHTRSPGFGLVSTKKRRVVMEKRTEHEYTEKALEHTERSSVVTPRVSERLARKRSERKTYLVAAIMSSLGVTSAAALAVYYRFAWQTETGEFLVPEMIGTFLLTMGSAVGMEFWARWAHRALWHAQLWQMHESHHRPRDGAFELNDVFAITNAAPAIALLSYGFFNNGLFPGLCFGAGLGITIFGIAYMFVHDGLVHRRFPVGPIADVPYLRKVAAAHQLHHTYIFNGVPYGLFLGPKEIEEVGGMEELETEIKRRSTKITIAKS
ncbi:PREDICTED: beta-carotene 3-hydroxylase 1, chloroplastic-like [Fragaria vesca subsp. vesca]|uniref:beta-carotene 3-hydroxylase 1, chloroplastic-like n=1 Tax=Fragaria vesca subsp. vesca TaxID=101020 RepID=UPI0002C33A54|nr:PREDICTED: beta-carotene 3-hydroxylase 1, chloroplastic-like [Fragaria vesca subsp. vesca]